MAKKVIKMAVYTSETCHIKLDIKTINMSLFLRGVFRCKTSTSAKTHGLQSINSNKIGCYRKQ